MPQSVSSCVLIRHVVALNRQHEGRGTKGKKACRIGTQCAKKSPGCVNPGLLSLECLREVSTPSQPPWSVSVPKWYRASWSTLTSGSVSQSRQNGVQQKSVHLDLSVADGQSRFTKFVQEIADPGRGTHASILWSREAASRRMKLRWWRWFEASAARAPCHEAGVSG